MNGIIHGSELPDLMKRLLAEAVRNLQVDLVDPERSYTTEEAAEFLRVDTKAIHLYVKLGLPHYTQGKGFRFRRRDLIEWREKFRTVHESKRKRVA